MFAFPDKETIHKVTSSGTLSRQNSLHSTPLKSPLGAVLPTLRTVQDDLSISILMLDVLIKQVCRKLSTFFKRAQNQDLQKYLSIL